MFTQKEEKRIFSKITIDPKTQCWNWTGGLSDGYGRIYWRGKRYKAHRLIYGWKHNVIPEWKDKNSDELDHICNNRACVNPEHIKPVKPKINILRGNGAAAKNSRKTTCIHGHNSYYVNKSGTRICRECRRILDSSEKRILWRKSRAKKT